MKLYYSPGTCSLAPRIVALEAGLPLEAEKVDIASHKTETGGDYLAVNPKGYVPALALDDGGILTEGVAITQYLADRAPRSRLAPEAGTLQRYRLQEWLTFISSELHKAFSPWLFDPATPEGAKQQAKGMIARRFTALDRNLAGHRHLLGEDFTVADAYCFTVVGWSKHVGIDLAPYPNLGAYMARVSARPKVKEALSAEGIA